MFDTKRTVVVSTASLSNAITGMQDVSKHKGEILTNCHDALAFIHDALDVAGTPIMVEAVTGPLFSEPDCDAIDVFVDVDLDYDEVLPLYHFVVQVAIESPEARKLTVLDQFKARGWSVVR